MTITPAKHIPYSATDVSPEKTQVQIQQMLYNYGIEGIQWTSIGASVELRFVLTDEKRNRYTVRVRPPLIVVRKREAKRYGTVQNQVSTAASMRLLYYWLKSKLEAISYGLVTFQEEFLANIAGNLPGGEEVTVGDLIIPKLLGLELSDLAKALPEPHKP